MRSCPWHPGVPDLASERLKHSYSDHNAAVTSETGADLPP
jgi:hypothetical protein